MTISSMMGLQTALRGLLAEQEAINTTGHNIANANTPGYSRQTADLTESDALTIPAFSNVTGGGVQLGTGVDIATISRVRNLFLDVQYRAQNSAVGDASTRASILDQVQTGLAEPSDHGLGSQLNAFWNSWSDVANAPGSQAARQALINNASALATTFNSLDQQLSTIETQASTQYTALTGATGQVKSDASQIATLNQSISQSLAAGQNPNDLMDKRDALIDDLSSLAKVSVTDPGNGLLQISFGDAASPLVNGTSVNWPQTMTSAAGGQLGALLSLSGSSGQLATYRTSLDSIVNQLVTAVNGLHTATPFFSGSTAGTISVAATAATVQTSATSNPGANDVALAISALRGGAADQSYAAFVSTVGSDVQSVNSTQQVSQAVLASIDNQRKSVSGVSLDEEMTNLVTFQRGYQASARMLTTIDQMLDTLINRTGTVGL
ncbi:MAG: flagellar hook-associated protein FlgK [Solirubrobacteraceae bacterium]